jgi:hypothetical protein
MGEREEGRDESGAAVMPRVAMAAGDLQLGRGVPVLVDGS